MTQVWKTSEFWVMLGANIVGMVVLFGGLTTEQGSAINQQLPVLAGSIITLLTTFGFIKGRMELKQQVVVAMANVRMAQLQNATKAGIASTTGGFDVELKAAGI